MKYLPYSNIWIGNTKELKSLQSDGMRLVYEIGMTKYDVTHSPRSKTDPRPWVQVGGCEFRLRSWEVHAERPQDVNNLVDQVTGGDA